MTWLGVDPTLKSILLNSHMDVVPVYRKYWTHEPYEAEIDDEGRILARGSQDMKSVGMQYLRAVKVLKDQGIQLKRTVHLMYVPGKSCVNTVNFALHTIHTSRYSQTRRLAVTKERVHLFKLAHLND